VEVSTNLKFEELGETVPFVKDAAKPKKGKAKSQSISEVTSEAAAQDGGTTD
jgi:hypothetical protein